MAVRSLLTVIFAFTICISARAADFGRTVGAFSIGPSGAATYSIPLWTPPGPNGLTPAISLDYNSQGGNGIAGVGWNLSAVTSIERCGRTIHQDGTSSEVNYSPTSDKFCIGGNRLRLVTPGGIYGAADTVYQTELADYSRITARGQVGVGGSGPEFFIVQGKNGLVYQYGFTGLSIVRAGAAPTILRWMLNKVSDRSGNNYIIKYNNVLGQGFAVPDTISWTPVTSGSTSYKYEAKFNYINNRADKDSYLGRVTGIPISNRYRLESIQIKSDGVIERHYALSYETSPVTELSRLAQVRECADSTQGNCLLPTLFSYQAGQLGLSGGGTSGPPGSSTNVIWGRYDLNGDNRNDIAFKIGTNWYVSFGSVAGFSAPSPTGISNSLTTLLIGRFLPDGRDAIVQPGSPDKIVRWDNVAASFISVNSNVSHTTFPIAADYDGDGLADLISQAGTTLSIRRNTSTSLANLGFAATALSTANIASWNATWSAPSSFLNSGLRYTDFSGDGRQDIAGTILVSSGQGVPTVFLANVEAISSGYVARQPWTDRAYPAIRFNDDACTDRISSVNIYIAACNGSAATTLALPAPPLQMLDWDGDGKTDILVDNGGVFGVYYSTGSGLSGLATTSIPSAGSFFALDLDGDRQDDLIKVNGTSPVTYWTHAAISGPAYATHLPDLLSGVTDGFGVIQSVDYISTASGNYDPGTPTAMPLQISAARIVVARSSHSNGIGGTFNKTYHYSGARDIAKRGGASAAFQRMDETDERNGVITKTYFEQDFPRTGRVKQRDVLQSDGTLISRTEIVNTAVTLEATQYNERYFVYASKITETRNEVGAKNGQTVSTSVTNVSNVDAVNGNIRTIESVVTDTDYGSPASPTAGATWTRTTQLQFSPDTTNWCLGVATQQLVTQSSTAPGSGGAVTRRVDFDVDYPKCRVYQTTVEPLSSNYWLRTTLEFDDDAGNALPDFGNVTKVTVAGAGVPSRSSSMTWTAAGQFPATATNALGQQGSFGYDFTRALPTSETDANGLITSFEYDAFGRPTKTIRTDGTASQIRRVDCATYANYCNGNVRGIVFYDELASDQSTIRSNDDVIDKFGRVIQSWTKTLNTGGAELYSMVNIAYDPLGRIASQSAPCLTASCGTQYLTSYTYDLANRPTLISRPVSAGSAIAHTTSFDYRGASIEVTDSQLNKRKSFSDPNGWMRQLRDQSGYGQDFTYDPAGSLLAVRDTNNADLLYNVQYAYGVGAYQTAAYDADMGPRTRTYNALGELVGWSDAKGHSFSATFDALSRPLSRVEPDQKTFWVWGAAADNTASAKYIGQLRDVRTETTGGSLLYKDIYGYDAKGRLSQQTVSIPGEGNFTYDYAYHATLGLLESMQFPSVVGTRPKVAYEYRYGQLLKVTNAASTPTVYWEAKKTNELHAVTEEALGNNLTTRRSMDSVSGWLNSIKTGVTGSSNETSVQNLSYLYDQVGNLTQRQNGLLGLSENFYYDNLYRLDSSNVVGQPNPGADYTYQPNGNLDTNTTATGSYNYTVPQGACSYYPHSQPHAVRSIGSTVYCYDPNGNMVSRGGSAITWTSYNYPSQINSAGQSAQFSYGPDRQRWKMVFNDGTNTETTLYIGGAFEKVTSPALGTVYRHTITAAGAPVAILTRTSAGADTLRYVLSDQQGSIETLATSGGAFEARESFSAFGTRRNAETWMGGLSSEAGKALDAITRQGYTYQTVLGAMGLNHMNGRVQDALSGRFLSADPYIPDPSEPQSYNRYSYVRNNPLSFTDPSGFTDNPVGCTPYPYDNRTGSGGEFYNSVVIAARCANIHPGTPGVAFPTWGPNDNPPPYGGGPATTGGTEAWSGVSRWMDNVRYGLRHMVPSHASFVSGIRRLFGDARSDDFERELEIERTATMFETVGHAAAEAGNRYYPEVAKMGVTAVAGELAVAGLAARGVLATPKVASTKLQNIVNDLYKGTTNPSRVGTGTTADAVRHELATGQAVGGRFHSQKAADYARGLENWLRGNPNAPYQDRLVAQSVLDDLRSALGGGP